MEKVTEWLGWILKIGPAVKVQIGLSDGPSYEGMMGDITLEQLCSIAKNYVPTFITKNEDAVVIKCRKREV